MSKAALEEYLQARQLQSDKNDARNIRKNVNDARKGSSQAGVRWPFELLQNAHDAGPRADRNEITVKLYSDGSKFVFEHDGAPFTLQELTALLSGGSSKEFESTDTTGRFGTGFLVTHVLSAQTRLVGLLNSKAGFERFELQLDRAGDEDSILRNIGSCNEAILAAQPTDLTGDIPSARFEYVVDNSAALEGGIGAFRKAIPYLFGTCPRLGRAEFGSAGSRRDIWRAEPVVRNSFESGWVSARSIYVERASGASEEFVVLRFSTAEADTAPAALVVLKTEGKKSHVQIPAEGFPRIFRRFPIHGSGFLRINFVLDGAFEVDQERHRVFFSSNKALIRSALDAIPVGIAKAMSEQWNRAQLLASLAPVVTSSADIEDEEKKWWAEELGRTAQHLAGMPLVQTREGFVSGLRDGGQWWADFVQPRLLPSSVSDETSIERLWPLIDAAEGLCAPDLSLAADWSRIAIGWRSLGVKVDLVTLASLAQSVKGTHHELTQLELREDRHIWLAKFIDLVGECWTARNGIETKVLDGLLPDQIGTLRDPKELKREAAISDDLKQIAELVGIDIRARLLDKRIGEVASSLGLQYFFAALEKAIPATISEEDLLEEILARIEGTLKEDQRVEINSSVVSGSVQLLNYLWGSRGQPALSVARRCPLVALDNSTVRWSESRQMMAPVPTWHEDARPFYHAYPPQRILSPIYCVNDGSLPDVVSALLAWQIAISDPHASNVPSELKERRLEALVADGQDVQGVTVSGETFSQIALLQPEVINRCQEGDTEARALLGLTLQYVARYDPLWKQVRTVIGKRAGKPVDVQVRGALWLADLRTRAWVPARGEDGKTQKVLATADSLKPLLDPKWLVGNNEAIELLSRFFGFDFLDLYLLGNIPDTAERQAVRERLAKLVEMGGGDQDFYRELADEVEEKRKRAQNVHRCQKLGQAVQEAIESALQARNLNIKLIDDGFDYLVSKDQNADLSEVSQWFKIGVHRLEVKATTSGEIRMTPKQAMTASAHCDRYSLCVVDLRSLPQERLDAAWTGSDVEPLARITSDIGQQIRLTHELVEAARTREIRIRNHEALRYGVPNQIWEAGCSIDEWVSKVSSDNPVLHPV